MTETATNKKPGLSLGKLSAVAQIAVKSAQPADAHLALERIYSIKQVRQKIRNLDELAESFKLNGIIEPLVVHEEADGRYRIIVGERRYRAAPLAGLTKVPVIIKKGLTELQIRRMQVTENNDRDDLTAYEESMGVIEDVEQYGTKEAMMIWNRGEAWVSKRMAVLRYADPVRELLENDLCGDFEVLHCLNQIYDIEDTHTEFSRLAHRMKEGLPLSRDEARNTLTRMKAWKQQQKELAERRLDLVKAKKSHEKTSATPPPPEGDTPQRKSKRRVGNTQGGEESQGDQAAFNSTSGTVAANVSPGAGEAWLAMGTSDAKVDGADQDRAKLKLRSMQEKIAETGEASQVMFYGLKQQMAMLGFDLHETEWVLWQGFLASTLPVLSGIGPDRAIMYLKKLQGELKEKTPTLLREEILPTIEGEGRIVSADMPKGWRF